MSFDETVKDVSDMNADELAAFAQRLGMPVEQLKSPDYPTFRDGHQYKIEVYGAENKVSKLLSDQVELQFYALDADDQPVKKARGRLWLTYPFDSQEFRFRDAETRERSILDMWTLLQQDGAAQYMAYTSSQREGTKTRYYHGEMELVGPQINKSRDNARFRAMDEMLKRKQSGGVEWIGARCYAKFVINEKDGKTFRNWYLSREAFKGCPLLNEPKEMMTRPYSGGLVNHAEEDLF